MAQSLVLSIDICRGLGISPLRINVWLSLSQADLGSRSAQELLFTFFFFKFETFFPKICAHSERYRNILAGIFEVRAFFLATSRFRCHRSKTLEYCARVQCAPAEPFTNVCCVLFSLEMWNPLRPKYKKQNKTISGEKKEEKNIRKGSAGTHSTRVQNFRVYLSKTAWALDSEGIWVL